MGLTGIVLAAGAGTRAGGPKALSRTAAGEPWLERAVAVLQAGGCDRVIVVLGAEAERAVELLPRTAEAVIAQDWAMGMSASLRAGLQAADSDGPSGTRGQAALVTLVDLPELPAAAARRVVGDWAGATPAQHGSGGRSVLRRAAYEGRPGHPVLIGADHWGPLTATLTSSLTAALAESSFADHGGQAYLDAHSVRLVECGDLFDGQDHDHA